VKLKQQQLPGYFTISACVWHAVHGPLGAVIIKQALPYVRAVGESFPLSRVRRQQQQQQQHQLPSSCSFSGSTGRQAASAGKHHNEHRQMFLWPGVLNACITLQSTDGDALACCHPAVQPLRIVTIRTRQAATASDALLLSC
jgi:hypothetical protein